MLPPAGRKYVHSFQNRQADSKTAFRDPLRKQPPPSLHNLTHRPSFPLQVDFLCVDACAPETHAALWALQTAGSFEATNTSISLSPSLLLSQWREVEKKSDDAAFFLFTISE